MPSFSKHSRAAGFTLVELLVYIAIMGTLLAMIMNLYMAMGRAREKVVVINSVEVQGAAAMELMTQSIRNAQSVAVPADNATTSTLSLYTYTASTSPTTFFASSSVLYMTEGSTTTALTNARVVVASLQFANFTASTTEGSPKIVLTLTSASSSRVTPYTATFYGVGTVRNQL